MDMLGWIIFVSCPILEVKMYCHYIGWCIGNDLLYRGVLYQRFHCTCTHITASRETCGRGSDHSTMTYWKTCCLRSTFPTSHIRQIWQHTFVPALVQGQSALLNATHTYKCTCIHGTCTHTHIPDLVTHTMYILYMHIAQFTSSSGLKGFDLTSLSYKAG